MREWAPAQSAGPIDVRPGEYMNGLADLRMFREIASSASLSIAAGRLGMAPATISGRLKALEDHYGVKLLRRTTRSVSLTHEGRMLLERSRDLLDCFDELEHAMDESKRRVAGRIAISSPAAFGRRVILPLARAYAALHPDIDFVFNFAPGEPSPELDFDIVIRTGDLPDSRWITRKLTQLDLLTCAAPSYLAAAGVPATPDTLTGHQCLLQMPAGGRSDVWWFSCDGRRHAVRVNGRFGATDLQTLVDLAVNGCGIVRAPVEEVGSFIACGALRPLLEAYAPPPLSVHLLTEGRSRLPARTADFIDYLVGQVRTRPAAASPRPFPPHFPASQEIRCDVIM